MFGVDIHVTFDVTSPMITTGYGIYKAFFKESISIRN